MGNAVKALQAVRVAALAALLGMPAQAAVAQENAIAMPLNDAALVQPRHVTRKPRATAAATRSRSARPGLTAASIPILSRSFQARFP